MISLRNNRTQSFIELAKPRVTWLILMSTAAGYYFGHAGSWHWLAFIHTLFGTGFMASGTATLNQWYERDSDAQMKRTRNRPLPSGRLSPLEALLFGLAISFIGMLELAVGVNFLSALLCLLTWAMYLFIYTPLKQKTWWSTTFGALPGAMPPIIGFAAAAGSLTTAAWVMGAILFFWQFPHFYSIAWMYREDYSRAGIRMLPVIEPDGRSTARQIILCAALLIPISFLPKALGMSGYLYAAGAALLGMWYLYSGIQIAKNRTRPQARKVLLTSVAYLPLLYILMILDPAWL